MSHALRSNRLKSFPASALTGPALWAAAKLRVAQWDRQLIRPRRVQLETLLSHCHKSAGTEFGRAHGFDSVRTYEDFRARVPLRTYADFEPYLVRMRRGERDVLYPGLIPFYGCSSGSSNTAALNKFLPISREQISWQKKAGFDLVARYVTMTGDLGCAGGYSLALLPPGTIKPEGPVGITTNPGLMQLHVPRPARWLTLPRPPIRDIEDYNQKLTVMADAYLDYDVRAMTGTTCWFSLLFDRLIAAARARGRAVETVDQIWPNLRVLFGGGVYAEPYRKIIDARMGRSITLMDNYNATEGGIFAATDSLDENSLRVIPDRGVFFEFVPREEQGKPNAKRVPLWEVEPNVDYSVALTTSSGLYSYVIGDFVRFTSVFPHRLQFAGRASGVLSITQELTSYLEIERAVAGASAQHPCTIVDFAASAEVGVGATAKGRYVFFMEFEREPTDLAAFAAAVDRRLCGENRVYREHRENDVAILPPRVVPLARGATRKFMEALGQNSVQQKFPRVVDERRVSLLRSFASGNAVEGTKGQS